MPDQRFGGGRSGDARVTSALLLPTNAGFANGLFVMTQPPTIRTTSVAPPKEELRPHLRVETIANSAGGAAEVAIVAQPSTGFLNTRFYPDGSHGRHRRLLRPHHGRTHTFKILDSASLPARHDGTHWYGSGDCNDCLWHPRPQKRRNHWDRPAFNANPEQENLNKCEDGL